MSRLRNDWEVWALAAGTMLICMSVLALVGGILWGSLSVSEQRDAVVALPTLSTLYAIAANYWCEILITGVIGGVLMAMALKSMWSPFVLHIQTTTGAAAIRVAAGHVAIIER